MDSLSNPEHVRVDRETVLEVLDDLRRHLDDVDLDVIDGEFYWRCCRREVVEGIEQTRSALDNKDDQLFLRTYQSLRFHERDLPDINAYLFAGGRFRMRDAYVSLGSRRAFDPFRAHIEPGSEMWAKMRILSSAWSGQDVEQRLRDHVNGPRITDQIRLDFEPVPPRPPDWVAVRVAFRLEERETELDAFLSGRGAPLSLPHVVVTAALPFPPEGVIAALYNRIVVSEKGWDQQLQGAANIQERRVALRTWAVGLLVGQGDKTLSAIDEVCERIGQPEPITQTRFGEDRALLVARVPEAKPYVYARRRSP